MAKNAYYDSLGINDKRHSQKTDKKDFYSKISMTKSESSKSLNGNKGVLLGPWSPERFISSDTIVKLKWGPRVPIFLGK